MSQAVQALLTVAGLAAFIYIVWRDCQRVQKKRNDGPLWKSRW